MWWFAFFSFFLSKEFLLFNAELVFITSFLLLIGIALNKLGVIIMETLDSREKQIRDEFHSVMLQRVRTLSQTYTLVSNLCSLSYLVRTLAKGSKDYSLFFIDIMKASVPQQKRFYVLYNTIMVFKEAVLLQQQLSEKKTRKLYKRFVLLLLKSKEKKKEEARLAALPEPVIPYQPIKWFLFGKPKIEPRKKINVPLHTLCLQRISKKNRWLFSKLTQAMVAKILSNKGHGLKLRFVTSKKNNKHALRRLSPVLSLHMLRAFEYNWLLSEYLLVFYPGLVFSNYRDLYKMDQFMRPFHIVYALNYFCKVKGIFEQKN